MSQDGVTPEEVAQRPVDNREVFTAGANSLRGRSDQLTVHRYPSNVGDQDIPHYVMFFITKRSADIGTQENRAPTTDLKIDLSNANRALIKSAFVRDLLAKGSTALGLGDAFAGATKQVTQAVGLDVPLIGNLAQAGAGVAGAAAGWEAASTLFEANQRDRVTLKKCIALYLTGTPSTSYKAIWQDKDIGVIGGLGQALENIGEAADAGGFISALMETFTGDSTKAGAAAIGLANAPKLEGFGDIGALVQSNEGIAVNPFRTQLFQNMGFRTFSFTYNFLPKNSGEYFEVKEIIKTFKKYMHPTLKPDKIIMGYPAEFSIAYYYGDRENRELFRIGNCALTDMQINYGGTDFITFKNLKGAPAEISMQLQFTELEILTEDRIEEGY